MSRSDSKYTGITGSPMWDTPQKQARAQAHDTQGNHRLPSQAGSWSRWCIQALTTANPMPRAKRSR